MDEEKLLLWLPPFMLLLIVEFVFACLVFKLSKTISFFLIGLIVFQLAATSLLLTKPEPSYGEFAGADFRSAFVVFFGFWGIVLVWACSIIAATALYIRNRRRLSH